MNNNDGIIGRLDLCLKKVEKGVAYVAGFGILALMLYGCAGVLSRKFFNYPLHGVADISEVTMVAVALFGISYCQSEHGNVRMTLLTSKFSGKSAAFLDVMAGSIAILFISLVTYGSLKHAQSYWDLGGETYELYIPLWIIAYMVPSACALLLMRLLLQLFDALSRLTNEPSKPLSDLNPVLKYATQEVKND